MKDPEEDYEVDEEFSVPTKPDEEEDWDEITDYWK